MAATIQHGVWLAHGYQFSQQSCDGFGMAACTGPTLGSGWDSSSMLVHAIPRQLAGLAEETITNTSFTNASAAASKNATCASQGQDQDPEKPCYDWLIGLMCSMISATCSILGMIFMKEGAKQLEATPKVRYVDKDSKQIPTPHAPRSPPSIPVMALIVLMRVLRLCDRRLG